jgi:hypothetical protein
MKKSILAITLSLLFFTSNNNLKANNDNPDATNQDSFSQFIDKAKDWAIKAGISVTDSAKVALEKFKNYLAQTETGNQVKKAFIPATLIPAAATFLFFKLFSATDILGAGFCIVLWNWILSGSPERSTSLS